MNVSEGKGTSQEKVEKSEALNSGALSPDTQAHFSPL